MLITLHIICWRSLWNDTRRRSCCRRWTKASFCCRKIFQSLSSRPLSGYTASFCTSCSVFGRLVKRTLSVISLSVSLNLMLSVAQFQ